MNTFFLPIGAVVILLFLARRFVRKRENLAEQHERLEKIHNAEVRAMHQRDAAMDADEALGPLCMSLRERMASLTMAKAKAHNESDSTTQAMVKLVRQGSVVTLTLPARPASTTSPARPACVLRIVWVLREAHLSYLQQGHPVRKGHFTLQENQGTVTDYLDLATLEQTIGQRLAAHLAP